MKKPHFAIDEVQALVQARRVRWSITKAADPLKNDYGGNWKQNGWRILGEIESAAFHGSLGQAHLLYDVYGIRYDGTGWYVKVTIENVIDPAGVVAERLYAMSCHPLTAKLRTNAGEVEP